MDEDVMETPKPQHAVSTGSPPSHRKTPSGSSLLSKLSFIRPSTDSKPSTQGPEDGEPSIPGRAMATAVQQQKTRRRRGSLRKVALLGRGAQRDKKDSKPLTIDTAQAAAFMVDSPSVVTATAQLRHEHDALGLKLSDLTPRPSMDGYASRTSLTSSSVSSTSATHLPYRDGHSNSYTSTTDEEDVLQIPHSTTQLRPGMPLASGSESYFSSREPTVRRRSFHQTKSPLSYSGLSSTPRPLPESDYDYSETEWWGWVVLSVTWFVFVIGMGSCLDVWSWAWDVGKTPYAPPELEDDPTLPIVGYYPALMILTCVMAWVWVVVAWVGMKYFRHAKISGD
ncbi:hypothetical protein B0I35DRAFT_252325 [Stachybotrys elegans]|uniref:Uncharacterized protein n=1 Tax=Stachybotrys elegans TaxID=80388 RepID=A0A8K0ST93_9HYPO|nr:hypothetical protein B0I35DRAFT_252325 [Stachybotrys elegans]